MLKDSGIIQSTDFKIGLYTRSDIINPNPNLSPNCMNVQWFFDSSIGKRLGSSTTNSVTISSGGQSGFIVQNSLTNNLISYWKLDEVESVRYDSFSDYDLNQINNPLSITGKRNQAADIIRANSQALYINTASYGIAGSDLTFSTWVYLNSTGENILIARNNNNSSQSQWELNVDQSGRLQFAILTNGGSTYTEVNADSAGNLQTATWYNIVAWNSNGTHIGVSVNLSVNTTNFVGTHSASGLSTFTLGGASNGGTVSFGINARIDETSIWNRSLSLLERQQLYAGGSGNTYTSANDPKSWFSFDFGASNLRWLTVCAGSGIMASSNLGTTFVTIATTRTATFQYMDRSRNVLIATSDAYDQPLYWAGSAGTFAVALALNSAPKAKYSINYQGFCILLNSMDSNGNVSNRRFSYEDENTQLSGTWANGFDLPSSADDEVTGPFILNKFLYVSTKYKIFRLNYSGGNPDWQYIQVANFGFVPRTVKVFAVKGNQVAIGLDWSARLRIFYGYESDTISDNVESNNDYCEFAMDNISLVGSGLLVSNAEFDSNEYEYRLNVAIGAQSTQTTHAIILNGRTLAMYPYSNQPFNTMCMAQSANRQFLMGFDRSGLCHIMNSGNLDAGIIPINEVYDSPLLFTKSPSNVSKNKQINFFFSHNSCGTIYYQERFDFSRNSTPLLPLRNYNGEAELRGDEPTLQLIRTVDVPSVQNIYQFSLTSSAGTANPWRLTHFDLFGSDLGVGRGGI